MTIVNDLQNDFNEALKYGVQLRFKYYNQTVIGDYDDDTKIIQSGTDYWCSGLVQPIKSNQYSSEGLLVEQGKVLIDDKKIYVNGNVQTSGLGQIKIGVGSPVANEYQIVNDGQVTNWDINGSSVYKKMYVRYLTNGSFIGE